MRNEAEWEKDGKKPFERRTHSGLNMFLSIVFGPSVSAHPTLTVFPWPSCPGTWLYMVMTVWDEALNQPTHFPFVLASLISHKNLSKCSFPILLLLSKRTFIHRHRECQEAKSMWVMISCQEAGALRHIHRQCPQTFTLYQCSD